MGKGENGGMGEGVGKKTIRRKGASGVTIKNKMCVAAQNCVTITT